MPFHFLRLVIMGVALGVLAACTSGGGGTSSSGNTGGTSSSGNAGGGGGTSSSGTGGSAGVCPDILPTEGLTCPDAWIGKTCSFQYGDLCYDTKGTALCTAQGKYHILETTNEFACCPQEPPTPGADCSNELIVNGGTQFTCSYPSGDFTCAAPGVWQ